MKTIYGLIYFLFLLNTCIVKRRAYFTIWSIYCIVQIMLNHWKSIFAGKIYFASLPCSLLIWNFVIHVITVSFRVFIILLNRNETGIIKSYGNHITTGFCQSVTKSDYQAPSQQVKMICAKCKFHKSFGMSETVKRLLSWWIEWKNACLYAIFFYSSILLLPSACLYALICYLVC